MKRLHFIFALISFLLFILEVALAYFVNEDIRNLFTGAGVSSSSVIPYYAIPIIGLAIGLVIPIVYLYWGIMEERDKIDGFEIFKDVILLLGSFVLVVFLIYVGVYQSIYFLGGIVQLDEQIGRL